MYFRYHYNAFCEHGVGELALSFRHIFLTGNLWNPKSLLFSNSNDFVFGSMQIGLLMSSAAAESIQRYQWHLADYVGINLSGPLTF